MLSNLWFLISAYPFGKTSGIMELTPSTFPSFLKTHKPVVVLFYAPWCGYCKQFHSEYQKLADSTKGAIRLGAINADEHRSIGQQFNVRGFPTIKVWGMGKKSLSLPGDYNGPRTATALQSFMLGGIKSDLVNQSARSVEDLVRLVFQSAKEKIAVLFSQKSKVAPIFSVLASSPRLSNLTFVFIRDVNNSVGAAFGVTKLPTVAVLQRKVHVVGTTADVGHNAGDTEATQRHASSVEDIEVIAYSSEQKIEYESMARFFLRQLEEGGATSGEAAAPLHAEEGHEEMGTRTERWNETHHSPSQSAPVPFTKDILPRFCSFNAPKIHGSVPWCVITLIPAFNLKEVHDKFQHDPLLFFDASQSPEELYSAFSSISVSPERLLRGEAEGSAIPHVLLWRQTKQDTIRYQVLKDVVSNEHLENFLQRLLSGDIRSQSIHIPS